MNEDWLSIPLVLARIPEFYEPISAFNQSQEDNRYVVFRIKTGNIDGEKDVVVSILYNEVFVKTYNLTGLSLLFDLWAIASCFCLSYSDIGLLSSRFTLDTFGQIAIDGDLGMNKGFLYEAAVASSLQKAGLNPISSGSPAASRSISSSTTTAVRP